PSSTARRPRSTRGPTSSPSDSPRSVSDMADEPAVETSVRPALRERVHIRLVKWGVSLPSVAEDVLDVDLVLGGPLNLVEGQMPETGERLLVLWEDANGPHQLPCEMGAVLPRELPQWQVRPAGLARSEQRRRHVRVHADSS